MLCIQIGAKVKDENRLRMGWHQFYMKPRGEMELLFDVRSNILDNTFIVAEMCNFEMAYGENHYPVFRKSNGDDVCNGEFLRNLCLKRLKERYGVEYIATNDLEKFAKKKKEAVGFDEVSQEEKHSAENVSRRLDYELSIIEKTEFIDYFLIVWDF
jgi:DNA polymerase-3 subunit alpha